MKKMSEKRTRESSHTIICCGIIILLGLASLLAGSAVAKPIDKMPLKVVTVMQTDTVEKKISPKLLSQYEGEYVLKSSEKTLEFKAYIEGGKLMVHPAGQPVGAMKYVGNHTFIHKRNPDIKIVFGVEKEKAQTVVLHQRGREISGKRKEIQSK